MEKLILLTLVPVWIFLWVSAAGVFAMFTLDRNIGKWWSLPLWMSGFVPGLAAMVLGIVYVIWHFVDTD